MLYNTTINRYMCTYNVFCTGITINEGGKKSISTKKEEKVVKMKSMCMCAFNMTFMCVYPQKSETAKGGNCSYTRVSTTYK